MANSLGVFLGELIRRPTQVVALAPSSTALAREMAVMVPEGPGAVVELGPGTGKITTALLEAGVPAQDLHLFELNPVFVDLLRQDFPDVNVRQDRAENARDYVEGSVKAVVSGLPLLSMPFEVQRAIVGGAFDLMGPEGRYIQFTYGPKPPVTERLRGELGLTWTKSRKIWGNLPPARVYTFTRSGN
ncbi:class I SAM-dependent methyltransferase [Cognatishimia sp.]|uniref:class I SAM-dependent methyltransferase n=1 Tax=Cognatishimia sp. TaxID=2211648 RepID=UPI00351236AB|nr:methyltransferase type 12 [Cognatishimia sp.]